MLLAQRVFVFVEVDNHIADLSTLVTHGIIGGALQIGDLGIALEQTDQRQCELGLACAFLAVDIQHGERAGAVSDDVPEQGGKIEADGHNAVVAIQLMKQGKVLFGRDFPLGRMDETALVDKGGLVALVDLRQGGKVEVLVIETDHAVLVNGLPLAFIDDAIAEGIEASLAGVVPAQLGDALRLLGLAIDIGFQQFVFLLFLEETEIALALYLLLKAVELGDIGLLLFDGFLGA